jgi:hypothetical protein
MNWQQILILAIIVGAAVLLVWRGSGKQSGGGCKCGCSHDAGPVKEKK